MKKKRYEYECPHAASKVYLCVNDVHIGKPLYSRGKNTSLCSLSLGVSVSALLYGTLSLRGKVFL